MVRAWKDQKIVRKYALTKMGIAVIIININDHLLEPGTVIYTLHAIFSLNAHYGSIITLNFGMRNVLLWIPQT